MKITRELVERFDWSKTSVGPYETWPKSLRSFVAMMLALPTPAIVFWGKDHTQIYNDGYAEIMGPRHPRFFGGTFEACWPETFPLFGATMDAILEDGRHFVVDRAQITMTRHGFAEEAHFTFTFSPVYDDDGKIAGVYQPVVEVTDSVLRDRRLETLRVLGGARGEVLRGATEALAANPLDIPLSAIFTWNEHHGELELRAASGLGSNGATSAAPLLAPYARTIREIFDARESRVVTVDLPPSGPWPERVNAMFVIPLRRSESETPLGVICFGLSPRLRFDEPYRELLRAITRGIGVSLAIGHAAQVEAESHARAQALLEESARLREENARRLALLFENAPVGIAVLTGPNHVFEVANPGYSRLVGNRPLLGRPLAEALPELKGQGILELVDRVYSSGEPFTGASIPVTVVTAEGIAEERFFDFAYQAVPGPDGRTESVMVVVFETTELSKAQREAEAASRAKDGFFAMLGHELRNPLAPITTALQLIRLRGDARPGDEHDVIERQVAHLTRLVDDLLDVSRIAGGKVALKLVPIELATAVKSAVEIASPLLEQRRHRLDVDVPASGIVVAADPTRLAQVFANLLTNAAKYTPPDGEIRVRARARDGRAILSVTDNGIGIDPGIIGRVFEPFAQDVQSIDRAQGGLGLGLAIVSNLVKLHGGTVGVESAGPGKGSTFTVELPTTELPAERAPAKDERTSPRSDRSGLRVLVVDDNEDAADMLGEALRALGCEVRIANDGVAALEAAGELDPELALVDIGLPAMDGYELADRLRKSTPFGERVRLVAVTGYGQRSDRERAAEAGFDAHLVKPVQLDVVAELVEHCRASALPGHSSAITKASTRL